MCPNMLRIERPIIGHNERRDTLAARLVRDTHDGRLAHAWALIDHAFNHRGVDIETPDNNEILRTAHQREKARFVSLAYVPAVEPSLGIEAVGGRTRPLPV